MLYGYASQTCTPHSLLPVSTFSGSSSSKDIGLVTLSSDATVRACSTTAPPTEAKSNVVRGEILGGIGGIGFGTLAYYGHSERAVKQEQVGEGDAEDGEHGLDVDDEGEEEVWDDMAVVEDDGELDDSEDDDSSDEERPVKAKKAKGGRR